MSPAEEGGREKEEGEKPGDPLGLAAPHGGLRRMRSWPRLTAGTAEPALQAGCYVYKAHLEAGPGRRAARGARDGAFADVFIAVEGAGPNAVTDPERELIGTGEERARSGAAPALRPRGKGGPLLGFEGLPSHPFQCGLLFEIHSIALPPLSGRLWKVEAHNRSCTC